MEEGCAGMEERGAAKGMAGVAREAALEAGGAATGSDGAGIAAARAAREAAGEAGNTTSVALCEDRELVKLGPEGEAGSAASVAFPAARELAKRGPEGEADGRRRSGKEPRTCDRGSHSGEGQWR